MDIKITKGKWLVNGKVTEELSEDEYKSLCVHLADIRHDYHLSQSSIHKEKKEVNKVFEIAGWVLFGFVVIYSFVKFICNQK